MIKNAEKETGPIQATENDPRITKIGKILRDTAMDELPQLVNILKGDMSFVVPRSLRPKEKEVHGNPDETDIEKVPGYQERLAVRPGLTGIAQIYLPTDALRKEKFQYDLLYIKKQSFFSTSRRPRPQAYLPVLLDYLQREMGKQGEKGKKMRR